MFRTAMLRTVAAASARAAVRPAARVSRAAVVCPRVAVPAVTSRLPSLVAVRMYSAAGGLNKEEVEGRIMSLLSGFDKVSSLHAVLGWDRVVEMHERGSAAC